MFNAAWSFSVDVNETYNVDVWTPKYERVAPLWSDIAQLQHVDLKVQRRSYPSGSIRRQNSIVHVKIQADGVLIPDSTSLPTNFMLADYYIRSGESFDQPFASKHHDIPLHRLSVCTDLYFAQALYVYEDFDLFFATRVYFFCRNATDTATSYSSMTITGGPGGTFQSIQEILEWMKTDPLGLLGNRNFSGRTGTLHSLTSSTTSPTLIAPFGVNDLRRMCQRVRTYSWNEHMSALASSCRDIQFNSIELLTGLRDISRLKDIPKGFSPKDLANKYLWKKYGLDNFLADIKAIAGIQRASRTHLVKRVRTSESYSNKGYNWVRTQCLGAELPSLDANASKVGRFLDKIEKLSLAPTSSRLWDLVPFSFAIDWILPVGDLLASMDGRAYISTLKPRVVVKSIKDTTPMDVVYPGYSFCGRTEFSYYRRFVSASLPPMEWVLNPTDLDVSEVVTGGALIISRR